MHDVTIVETDNPIAFNKALRDYYFDMVTDQTTGTVLQIKKCKDIHLLEAHGEGKVAYFFTVEVSPNTMEAHAIIPLESRGAWAVQAAKDAISLLHKQYRVSKVTSGHLDCSRSAGVFLCAVGFKRQETFDTGKTKDHIPVKYISYSLEV